MAKDTKNPANGEAQEEKAPRKPKFVPGTPEVLAEAGEFDTYTSKERKVKGGGVKPAETFKIATNRKQFLALFNGDEKAAYFYGSLAAANLAAKHAAKNSPEKIAEKNAKRAEKLLEKLPAEVLSALMQKLQSASA